MDTEAILPWIKSFDGVTDENCPDFDSLREGHVLAMIFNQLSDDNKIDIQSLNSIDKSKDDWFNCYKNWKIISEHVKEPFANFKLTSPIDITGISRLKNESLINFVSMLVVFSLKCSKKDEILKKTRSLPKTTQAAIKEAITSQKNKASASTGSQNASESTPSKAVPTTPTKQDSSASTPDVRLQKVKLEVELRRLEREKDQLLSENSDLKNEKERIKNLNSNSSSKPTESSQSFALIEEVMNQQKLEEDEIKALDDEIASLETYNQQKDKLQAEYEAVNARLRSLKQKVNQSAPTIEDFRSSTDPQAIKYLQEIDEAEKNIQPEHTEKLKLIIAKAKKEINSALEDLNEKVELLGGPQMLTSQPPDSPSKNDGSETEIKKIDDNNDISASLSNEIDALTEKNNQLNEEIVELMVRAEAIEKMKNQHSYLEHIRSSSIFMKPE